MYRQKDKSTDIIIHYRITLEIDIRAYETFQVTRQPEAFVDAIRELRNSTGVVSRDNAASQQQASEQQGLVRREDLRLICFEYVWACVR